MCCTSLPRVPPVVVRGLKFWAVQNFLPRPTPFRFSPASCHVYKSTVARFKLDIKARSHSALRLDHGQNPSKSGLPWSRRCCSRWCRVYDELQSIYRRGRTRQKIGTASDAAKSFELLKILVRGQPRVAHVVKTCNTRATHVKHADNPCSGSD